MSGTGACWRDKEAAAAAAARRTRPPSPPLLFWSSAAAATATAPLPAQTTTTTTSPDLLLLLQTKRGRLRSGLGPQVLSSHATAPAASFGSGEQRPRASGGGGGGLPPRPAGLGPQVESTRPTAPASGFGTGARMLGGGSSSRAAGGNSSAAAHPVPPGPGAADLALVKRSAPRVRFASAPRDAARRVAEPDPAARRGGAGPCGGSAESPPPGAYSPLGAMGGRQPTRPAAPGVRFGGGGGGAACASSPSSSSSAAAAVPGVGEYSTGAAVAALNLVSIHRTAPAHSFGSGRRPGPPPLASSGGGGSTGRTSSSGRGAAASPDHLLTRSKAAPSPGPADTAPPLAAASARQVLSTRPNAPRAGFGGGARRAGMAAASARGVPGVGTYDA